MGGVAEHPGSESGRDRSRWGEGPLAVADARLAAQGAHKREDNVPANEAGGLDAQDRDVKGPWITPPTRWLRALRRCGGRAVLASGLLRLLDAFVEARDVGSGGLMAIGECVGAELKVGRALMYRIDSIANAANLAAKIKVEILIRGRKHVVVRGGGEG